MRGIKIYSTTAIFCLVGIFLIQSCTYDVEEELYPVTGCQSSDMSYAEDIVPLIDINCYVCHAANVNFGNVTLDSYEEIVKYVNNNRLLGAIRHESGFSFMPQGAPKLLDCQIEKIESWINDGAPNN